jgi:hypothetical protein
MEILLRYDEAKLRMENKSEKLGWINFQEEIIDEYISSRNDFFP